MSRKGRPRRQGVERDASGRIKSNFYRLSKPERRVAMDGLSTDKHALAVWKRTKELIVQQVIDPRLGTKLGKMFLIADPIGVTAAEFEAGNRFAQILFDYDRLVLGKHRTAQAQNLARVRGLGWIDENPDNVKRAANAVMLCLVALGGREIIRADEEGREEKVWIKDGVCNVTEALCRDEDHVGNYRAAKVGLEILVGHFGLADDKSGRIKRWQDRYRALRESKKAA